VATICVVAAVLHFGSEIFLPLAVATLIAFALSPLVAALRQRGWPRLIAVMCAVTLAFGILGNVLSVMASKLGLVAGNLPAFPTNIIAKLDALQAEEGRPARWGGSSTF
jgi:predicted PurR-regulated permease PerM